MWVGIRNWKGLVDYSLFSANDYGNLAFDSSTECVMIKYWYNKNSRVSDL
jgi:hypothetical protein